MGWRLAIGLSGCWMLVCAPLLVSAAELFPYRAKITAEEAAIQSGPGDNYYPVVKLPRGETVEVYRHDPGGWYAIRPPEGSFSWVAGEFVRPLENGLGEIMGERVVSRVGSRFSDIRDVIQVRLDNGEEVAILGVQPPAEGSTENKTWYKIAPPAGEFRWIAARFVEREGLAPPTTPVVRSESPEPQLYEPTASATPGTASSTPATAAPTGADKVIALEQKLQEMSSQLQALSQKTAAVGWMTKGQAPPRNSPPATTQSLPVATRKLPPSQASTVPELLGELELQFSEMVADDTLTWDFRQLSARVEETLARAESANDRGRARALLFKIEKFEDIRQRYATVVARRNAAERDAPATSTARLARRPQLEQDDGTPRYDGVGRLTQVVAQKAGAPPYALLDESGKVRYYVSPAPGVNLRGYLGYDVGVSGILGYLPDQEVRHVTAKRIESLEAPTLR